MTYGEAVQDPSTKLGQDAVKCANDRSKRIEAAKAIAADRGISLEDALLSIWSNQ